MNADPSPSSVPPAGPPEAAVRGLRRHTGLMIGLAFAATAGWITWSHLRPEAPTAALPSPAPSVIAVARPAEGLPAGPALEAPAITNASHRQAAGRTTLAAPTEPAPAPAATLIPVPASEPPSIAPLDEVRGVIKAGEEVVFSSRLAARIADMPLKEGERFARGRPLVVFDCTRMQAEARAAWAAHRANETLVRQNTELDRFQAIGRNELEIARARADQSRAEALGLDATLKDCLISAPFAGLVLENVAHRHEVSAPGKDLLKVINDETLEVHLVAPSAWLRWLKPGQRFEFRVDETGRTHAGRIARLGASVDPVSQTIRMVGALDGARHDVLPGMSGSAVFDPAGAVSRPAAQAPATPTRPHAPSRGPSLARQ